MNETGEGRFGHLDSVRKGGSEITDEPETEGVKETGQSSYVTISRGRRGFTIVELLVTVSVIGILMGILLPALGHAKSAAKMTNELAAARELMVAYFLYAGDNKDRVLPGYKDDLPACDQYGTPLEEVSAPVVAARYPWRIAPYLDYEFRGLYKNEHRSVLEEMEYTSHENYVYVVSLSPSLGINATWVGGDQNQLGFNQTAIDTYGKFYVTSLTEARFPERLLVFTSARGLDPMGVVSNGIVEGYFKVMSPRFSESAGYLWPELFRQAKEPDDYGFVSLRYRLRAVTAFIDGHIGALGEDELSDMRYWANLADDPDWGLKPLDDDP